MQRYTLMNKSACPTTEWSKAILLSSDDCLCPRDDGSIGLYSDMEEELQKESAGWRIIYNEVVAENNKICLTLDRVRQEKDKEIATLVAQRNGYMHGQDKMMERYNLILSEKDQEIATLKSEIERLRIKLDEMHRGISHRSFMRHAPYVSHEAPKEDKWRSTMICNNCHQYGIYWKNLGGITPYTYCPHCHHTNCQAPEIQREEEADDNEVPYEPA